MWKSFRDIEWSEDLKEIVSDRLFGAYILSQKCLVKNIECKYPYIEDLIDAYQENLEFLMNPDSEIFSRIAIQSDTPLEAFLLRNLHRVILENKEYLEGLTENVLLIGDNLDNFHTITFPHNQHLALINKLKCAENWDNFFKDKRREVIKLAEKLDINLAKREYYGEECEEIKLLNSASLMLYRKLTSRNSILFKILESYPNSSLTVEDILSNLYDILFKTEDSILVERKREERVVKEAKSFKKWFDEYSSLNMSISDWFLGGYSTIPDEYLEEALKILNLKTKDDPLEALAKISNIASIVDYCGGQAKSEEEFYKNFIKCVISRIVAGKRLDRFTKKEEEEVWSDIEE